MVEGLCVGEAILGETDRCGCGEGCGIASVVGARRRGINRQDSYVCIWSKTRKSQSDSMSIYRMGTRRSYGWLSSLLQNGQKRERERITACQARCGGRGYATALAAQLEQDGPFRWWRATWRKIWPRVVQSIDGLARAEGRETRRRDDQPGSVCLCCPLRGEFGKTRVM